MRAPIFEACWADTTVQSLVGGTELRVYQFGDAPQDCKVPYVTWQVVYGEPFNSLNDRPTMDSFGLQIDVIGPEDDPRPARLLTKALVNAIEPYGYVVSWNGESRDPETKQYVVTFTVDWIVTRT